LGEDETANEHDPWQRRRLYGVPHQPILKHTPDPKVTAAPHSENAHRAAKMGGIITRSQRNFPTPAAFLDNVPTPISQRSEFPQKATDDPSPAGAKNPEGSKGMIIIPLPWPAATDLTRAPDHQQSPHRKQASVHPPRELRRQKKNPSPFSAKRDANYRKSIFGPLGPLRIAIMTAYE
jgi:hypothetical protein